MISSSALLRTAQSMTAFQQRGGTMNSKRAIILIDRYEALRAETPSDEWAEFCKMLAFAPEHTAYDFFA